MSIRVEFYGIPRQRAGCDHLLVPITAASISLAELLRELRQRCSQLAADCFHGDQLRPGFAANIDGERFVRDEATQIRDGQCVLIMSADAGG